MAYINLNSITVPTPEPYNKSDATRNNENFYYVMLQILNLLKSAAFKIPDKDETNTAEILALQDLIYNGQIIDIGPLKIVFSGKTISIIEP